LGLYYYKQKNYIDMKKYYLMAIEKKNTTAMNNLAIFYKKFKDYDNTKKYYLLAFQHFDFSKYDQAIKIFYKNNDMSSVLESMFLKSITKNNFISVNKIFEENFDYDIGLKYHKYLNQKNKGLLNKWILYYDDIERPLIEKCYICYEENIRGCYKYCSCNRNYQCIKCFIEYPKCIICEN